MLDLHGCAGIPRNQFREYNFMVDFAKQTEEFRVPTRLAKPGKMRVHLENLEISWNFEKINKYHGKMILYLEKLGGY